MDVGHMVGLLYNPSSNFKPPKFTLERFAMAGALLWVLLALASIGLMAWSPVDRWMKLNSIRPEWVAYALFSLMPAWIVLTVVLLKTGRIQQADIPVDSDNDPSLSLKEWKQRQDRQVGIPTSR